MHPQDPLGSLRRRRIVSLLVRTKIALGTAVVALFAAGADVRSNDLPPHEPSLEGPPSEPVLQCSSCPLCDLPAGIRRVRLDAADVDSLGRAISAFNEAQVIAVDSCFKSGRLGPPESEAARKRAHLWSRLRMWNAYAYVARFATDSTCVYEANESSLTEAFAHFTDPGIYPIVRLRRARMGLGHLCLQYDVSGELDVRVAMGTKSVRVRTRTIELDGAKRRVLAMDLPTGLDDLVEVLVDPHYTCIVERRVVQSDTGPYETVIMDQIQGLRLRRMGTHVPRAILFWTAPPEVAERDLPPQPRVGVRIYVPHLRLKLPSFLPDIGFDDLREVDLPQPIVRLEYLKDGPNPVWLPQGRNIGFADWKGHGPVPQELRARFPDL